MVYEPGIKAVGEMESPACWFLFYGDKMLVSVDNMSCCKHIPRIDYIKEFLPGVTDIQYLGTADGEPCYTGSLSAGDVPAGYALEGLRQLYGSVEDDWYWLANRAYHLAGWRKKNRFCGCCGETLRESAEEVAMVCGRCGNIIYPRISPAVIVAITKGDRILLAHASRFAGRMYSVIAGFVEPGETLEECVHREVMEEVGLKVKNVRYFSSQPWPYPDSLMIAFTAEYESGEINIDNREITDAGWYSRDNLPELPSKVSVARKLIDNWLLK